MMIFHGTATTLVVLLVVACTPSPPSQTTGPVTPSGVNISAVPRASTPASNPVDQAHEQSTQTYRRMWAAFATAGTTADWRSPELGRHATGIALSTLTKALFDYSQKRIVTRGQPDLAPTVHSVEPAASPTKVIVTDCGDSTNWTKHYADTGLSADDEPDGKRRINAVVEKQIDGSWKVTDFGVHEVGTC